METQIIVNRPIESDQPIFICDQTADILIQADLTSARDIHLLGKELIIEKGVIVTSKEGDVQATGVRWMELKERAHISAPEGVANVGDACFPYDLLSSGRHISPNVREFVQIKIA